MRYKISIQLERTFFYLSQDAIKDKKLTIVETKQKLQTGPAKNLQPPHQSFGIFTLKFMTLGVNFTNILQTPFA
jgi:hypothetical protein